MEPADGAQRHQSDARRHRGARGLRGFPSALNTPPKKGGRLDDGFGARGPVPAPRIERRLSVSKAVRDLHHPWCDLHRDHFNRTALAATPNYHCSTRSKARFWRVASRSNRRIASDEHDRRGTAAPTNRAMGRSSGSRNGAYACCPRLVGLVANENLSHGARDCGGHRYLNRATSYPATLVDSRVTVRQSQ